MHVRFAPTVEVAKAVTDDAEIALEMSRSFVSLLRRHGRLAFSSETELRGFFEAAIRGNGIQAAERELWQQLLAYLRKTGRITIDPAVPASVERLVDIDSLSLADASPVDVLIVGRDQAHRLGLNTEGHLRLSTRATDIASRTAVARASHVSRTMRLEQNGLVPTGASRQDFWSDVIEPIAREARSVTFLDRYFFRSSLELARGSTHALAWRKQQLSWFLSRLDRVLSPGAKVTLIGEQVERADRGVTTRKLADAIKTAWPAGDGGRIGTVEVVLTAWRRDNRFPHDRHMRFSTGAAITFPSGLDRLDGAEITDPDGMHWNYRFAQDALDNLRGSENRAAKNALDPVGSVVIERAA